MLRFRHGTDYKTEFKMAVNELIAQGITDRVERMKVVEALINEYVTGIGTIPEDKPLEWLTDYILREELTENGGGHKVTNTEYPFLSATQLERRQFGARGGESSNMNGETSLAVASNVATDGTDYQYPSKRRRTSDENEFIDKHAKIRNDERRKQYRKDTAPGEIVKYHVDPEALDRHLTSTYGVKYKR